MKRALGIDPGLAATGYGVVEEKEGRVAHVAHGVLRPGKGSLPLKLKAIFEGISQIIALHSPDLVVVEAVFSHLNPRSSLLLGQARGAAVVAAGVAHIPVHEISPLAVKQAVTGFGHAAKVQVQAMVCRHLGLNVPPPQDAADALAVAIATLWGGGSESIASL